MAGHQEADGMGGDDTPKALFAFGMKYATGDAVAQDLVAAHKLFNLAALRGYHEAVRLRREIAAEMSPAQIFQAQRAARDWLATR